MMRPKKRGMYAIHEGSRSGGFVVFIHSDNVSKSYAALFIPNPMEAIYLAHDEIHNMLKNETLKLVQRLPKEVYEVCEANYYYFKEKK